MMSGNHTLAFVGGAAALLAAFAGAPDTAPRTPPKARDHIPAVALAQWIREQRSVHVLDVRSAAAFHEFAVPTATHATLTGLRTLALPRHDTVVVVADSGAAAAQAMLALRARGFEHVYVLSGGIYAWLTDVLSPTLPDLATAEQETAFARVAELSRYFGGVPRRGEPVAERAAGVDSGVAAQQARDAAAARRIRRRGC